MNTNEWLNQATISFSIFWILPSTDTMDALSKKAEGLSATHGTGSDKKKAAKLHLELSVSEQLLVQDFNILFDCLYTQSPIALSFVDYRFLVDDIEGPMTEEEKDVVSSYLKFQENFSNLRVANTRTFLEKMPHLH